jgi:hypothetical protein
VMDSAQTTCLSRELQAIWITFKGRIFKPLSFETSRSEIVI